MQNVFQYIEGDIVTLIRYLRCLLHGHNKCLERALVAAMGVAGIGKNGCLQLLYNIINMHQMIKTELKIKGYDELVEDVLKEVQKREEWKKEAEDVLKNSTKALWDFFDDPDHEITRDELNEAGLGGVRNLQLPILTRWQTTLPAIAKVCINPILHYFMAVVGAEKARSSSTNKNSYMETVCNEVIALFKLQAKSDDENIKSPSVLMTQLRFVNGFAKAVYNNMFTLTCRADEQFGSNSQGHIG